MGLSSKKSSKAVARGRGLPAPKGRELEGPKGKLHGPLRPEAPVNAQYRYMPYAESTPRKDSTRIRQKDDRSYGQ